MTISFTTNIVTGTGNGSATVFSFSPMEIFATSDLEVRHYDANDVETLLTEGTGASNYSVSTTTPLTQGKSSGSVTYPADEVTPMPSGEKIIIKLVVPLTQSTDLENRGAFLPETLEEQLDRFSIQSEQQQEEINRSLKVRLDDNAADATLPKLVADEFLKVNSAADGFETTVAVSGSAVASNDTPEDVGTAGSAGTSSDFSRSDHVHAGNSGMEFIATYDAAGESEKDFTEFDATRYDAYMFVLQNVIPANDAVSLHLLTSTDGGASFDVGASDYKWNTALRTASDADNFWSTRGGNGDTEIPLPGASVIGSAANEDGLSGIVKLHGPHLAKRTMLTWEASFIAGNGSFALIVGNGMRDAAEDVDAVRFIFSAGNIESGTITMYGLRNA